MLIKSFNNIKTLKESGGKEFSLAKMFNAGINVPDGFVVLSSAFDEFLKENGIKTKVAQLIKNSTDQDSTSKEINNK
ncbi:MAG: PEP/pyruvate-binding domain-containing protein [Christensenellaceae bacterium]|jgi:pyruvate,water dikinase|nr:PEP/pyruvate-binding domain-containing protein [Christensenellaceae bacterium]